jgi:ketosteroid isomerase-like protein
MAKSTEVISPLERLVAIEAIKQLKARYFRCMDQKDWDAFEKVFAPDVVFDLREAIFARDPHTRKIMKSGDIQIREEQIKDEEWLQRGARNVRRWEETILTGVVTVHQGHMPEIELTSPTSARGYWHLEHLLRFPKRNAYADIWWLPDNAPFHEYHGYGLYDETYERIGDEWLIKTLKLTHFRVDIV